MWVCIFAAFESSDASWTAVTPRSVTSSRVEGPRSDAGLNAAFDHRPAQHVPTAQPHTADVHELTPDPWTQDADPWMQWLHDSSQAAPSTAPQPTQGMPDRWVVPGIGDVGPRQSFREQVGLSLGPFTAPPPLSTAMREPGPLSAPSWFGSTQQAFAQIQATHDMQGGSSTRNIPSLSQVPSAFMQYSGAASTSVPSSVPVGSLPAVVAPASHVTSVFSQVHALRATSGETRAAVPQPRAEQSVERPVFRGFVASCTVCLGDFAPGEDVSRLTCGHVYHTICLGELAAQTDVTFDAAGLMSLVCPSCRAEAQVMRTWRYPIAVPATEFVPTDPPDHAAEEQVLPEGGGTPDREATAPTEGDSPVPMATGLAPETPTPRRTDSSQDVFHSPAEAFPWWPVPDHSTVPQAQAQVSAYHSNVRLADGRVGLLVDPGSYGNLVGAQWLEEAVLRMHVQPNLIPRDSPLQVGGVGKGAQVCRDDCRMPISLTRQDGSVSAGSFTSPVVLQSGCPALLGLRSLQENRAILDLSKKQLHFVGPGEPTLVLPPGSETFQLETAISGHLLLPCASSAPATAGEHHLFADNALCASECHLAAIPSKLKVEHECLCEQACQQYDYAQAASLIVDIACQLHHAAVEGQSRFGDGLGWSVCLGAYTHGGTQGLTQATQDRPWLASLVAKVMNHKAVGETYTSIMLLVDAEAPVHIDRFNKGKNIVLPLKLPQHGGGLFVELCPGDHVTGKVEIYQDGSTQVAGQVLSLKEGEPVAFNPKAKHATQPWTRGHRVVLAAFTTGGYAKLSGTEREQLSALGYDMPAIPEVACFRQGGEDVHSEDGAALLGDSCSGVGSGTRAASPDDSCPSAKNGNRATTPSTPSSNPISKNGHGRSAGKAAKPERTPGLSVLRRVLLISIFHSTATAFLTQGWEPTRLRPLELLRSGFDDVVHRMKQAEYHAVWVDVADARQFAGQERTSQVCSRLAVLLSWAERQSVPVVLAASRRTAWKHDAFQQLVDRGQFSVSHHSWCRFDARMTSATSSAKHKVLSTVRLPNHDCRCPSSTEHIFDLDDKTPGSAKVRAQAEQKVVCGIVAALGQVLDAGQGSSRPSDPVSTTTFIASTTNTITCTGCGLVQTGLSCRVCEESTTAATVSQTHSVDPAARCILTASPRELEQCMVEPPVPDVHFPTESKLMQRQRKQATKAAGQELVVKRKRKIVEQHFDDCGEDLSSLSFPMHSSLLEDSAGSSSEEEALADALVQPQLNAFETWSGCGSAGIQPPPNIGPSTVIAVDVDEMLAILASPAFTSHGVELVELFGREGSDAYLCIRRRLQSGHPCELSVRAELGSPATRDKILQYLVQAKPIVVMMAPAVTAQPQPMHHSCSANAPLKSFSGQVAELQLQQGGYFLIEQPFPSSLYCAQPWDSVRQHAACSRVVLHECMLSYHAAPLRVRRPIELVANHGYLLQPFENLQCDGGHAHVQPSRGETHRWPHSMRQKIAYAINRLVRLSHGNRTRESASFPSVAVGANPEGEPDSEVPVDEQWRKCKGCLWRLQRHDKMHSRIRGQCKYPDSETIEFGCPACKARKNRSDEGHTFGPDCRHVLTQVRASAKQRRPFGRVPARTEPTGNLRGSSLGRQAERDAEEQDGEQHQASEPSSSSNAPPALGARPPSAGRGPDLEPRTRRTWSEADTQTPSGDDWTSFDVQASFRGLRHADEAGKRRILRKLHLRWWHCSTDKMLSLLKAGGLGRDVLDLVPAIADTCKVCRTWARPSPDAKASCRMVIGFNIEVEGDLMFYRHQGTQHIVLVLVDRGVRWLATTLVSDRQTNTLLTAIDRAWTAVYGPMQILIFDGETGLDDDDSTTYFQLRGITKRTSAPNQHTRIADRRIAVLRDALHKLGSQLNDEGLVVPFERMLHETTFALNALSSVNGCSPYTAVLGRVPAILPHEDSVVSDGIPDHCSGHSHRLREIAVQAIAEGTARERMKRALHSQTRPSGAELDFKIGDKVDWWREPVQKDAPGWRGPGSIVDLSRLEHGRIGVRTSTDQVITCRLQDVRHSLAFVTEELAAFFGEDDHIAPAGSQASFAQQHAQAFVDSLRVGSVITLGHIRTADGRWVETPQTEAHRAVYHACMYIAETVFRLTSVVAVRLARAVRSLTAREEYTSSLVLWWSSSGSRDIKFLHSETSRTSFVDLLGQSWDSVHAIQFLAVPDDEGWTTSARWTVPAPVAEHASADADSLDSVSQARLSTVPEEGESTATSSLVSWDRLCETFGDSIRTEEVPWLAEAYIANASESAPEAHHAVGLSELCRAVSMLETAEPCIPRWSEVQPPPECDWATGQQLEAYVAASATASENAPILDADDIGAYVALEVHGEHCKLIEGLEREPGEHECVELRMYEAHTRKAVIDRSDDLLTADEVRDHAAEVTKAILSELRTWQSFKCFKRRARVEAPCIIDAKWVYKWKYVQGERIIRARLCLRGFKETGADDQTNFASTASRFSQKLLVSECVLRGWVLASSDVPKAFLQGVSYEELASATDGAQRDVSFELTGEGLECLKALPEFTGFDPRREVLHCLKPGTGCRDAPKCFSLKLRQVTEAFGLKSSSIDSELEMLHRDGQLCMAIIKHVDDLKMIGPRALIEKFVNHLSATFGKMEVEWHVFTFCGVQHRQLDDGSVELDQIKFLSACKPISTPEALTGSPEALLPEAARRHFLSLLMTIAYSLLTRPDIAVFVTALQRESHQARVVHVKRLNLLLKWAQANPRKLTYPVMEYPDMLLQISDSSYKAKAEDGLSVRGLVSVRVCASGVNEGLPKVACHVLDYVSKAQRHVTRSTFSSELFAATDAVDSGLLQTVALHELVHGVLTPGDAKKLIEGDISCFTDLGLGIDARSVSSAIVAPNVKVPAEPSLLLHVCWIRALLARKRLKQLYWIDTRSMLADALTKGSCSRDLITTAMSGTLMMMQPYEVQEIRK